MQFLFKFRQAENPKKLNKSHKQTIKLRRKKTRNEERNLVTLLGKLHRELLETVLIHVRRYSRRNPVLDEVNFTAALDFNDATILCVLLQIKCMKSQCIKPTTEEWTKSIEGLFFITF